MWCLHVIACLLLSDVEKPNSYLDVLFVLSFSHTINLLSNLPVQCLDVLIDVPVQGGLEKYGGKNLDVVQVLLDFMEKRIDKVVQQKHIQPS